MTLEIDMLKEIYENLNNLGICRTQREFSRDFLGKSSGYYAQITSTGASPALAAIGTLVGVLHALVTNNAGRPADYAARRQIRSAWIAAAVMLDGERQRRRYPARRSPRLFDTPPEDNV
jgi:uncharacterized protein (DUF2236 family)